MEASANQSSHYWKAIKFLRMTLMRILVIWRNISYKSGARGSIENVASAIASIGQLYRGNNRLTIKSNTSRHSPYAEIGSKSIFDNGFIMSSYASGLTGAEVMQMAVPARESAIVVIELICRMWCNVSLNYASNLEEW